MSAPRLRHDSCDADQAPAHNVRDHRQNPQLLSGRELVVHEIHRPDIVRADGCLPIFPQLCFDPALWSLVAQLQAQVPVNAIGSLDVGAPTFAFQQHMHAPIAVAHTGLADLANTTFQAGLIGTARGVVVGRVIEVQRSAGTPDRDCPVPAHALHHLTLASRP